MWPDSKKDVLSLLSTAGERLAAGSAGRLLYLLVDCVPARGRCPPLGVERRQSIAVDSPPSTIYLLPPDLPATSPIHVRARSLLA